MKRRVCCRSPPPPPPAQSRSPLTCQASAALPSGAAAAGSGQGGHGMPPRSLHGGRRRTAFRAWHAVRVCYVNLVGWDAFKQPARWGWKGCAPMNASSMYHRPVKADSSSDWGVCASVTPSGWAHWSCASPCMPSLLPAKILRPACWIVTLHKQASSRTGHPAGVGPPPFVAAAAAAAPFIIPQINA